MNHLHLQETARHYANLAEQYHSQLVKEQELNEDLLGLVEALCEELGIDTEELLNEVTAFSSKDRQDPIKKDLEQHQLGRLTKLAGRFNQGEVKAPYAADRLRQLMVSRGANVNTKGGKLVSFPKTSGRPTPIDAKNSPSEQGIGTGDISEPGRARAAAEASHMSRFIRKQRKSV
jgi:hypothetical protein